MRIIAGLSLVVTCAIHLLLGGGSLLSSKYEAFEARTQADDLASVAGDLVDEETLAKEREKANQRADMSAANLKLGLGIVLLFAAATQALSALLLFIGRARGVMAILVGFSIIVSAVVIILSKVSILGVTGVSVLVLALVLALLSKPRRLA